MFATQFPHWSMLWRARLYRNHGIDVAGFCACPAEIWEQSAIFHLLRDSSNLNSKCGLCEFRNICLGGRARACGATGNSLNEKPWCVYKPRATENWSGREDLNLRPPGPESGGSMSTLSTGVYSLATYTRLHSISSMAFGCHPSCWLSNWLSEITPRQTECGPAKHRITRRSNRSLLRF